MARILVRGDEAGLAGTGAKAFARLLAEALATHLGDWCTLSPGGTDPVLRFEASATPVILGAFADQAAVEAAAPTPPVSVRAHHFIVVDPGDPALAIWMGALPTAAFDVVTPLVRYATRDAEIQAAKNARGSRLVPFAGKLMPAVLLDVPGPGPVGAFEPFPVAHDMSMVDPPERDACRMRVRPTDVISIAGGFSAMTAEVRQAMQRWARTVSWRRVGFVVSGGGASVFRLCDYFHWLEQNQVPIDMLAGVSGGTLFSALYAVGGLPKVRAFAARGPLFSLATTGALINSCVVQAYVDRELGGFGINDTEIRVVALSTRFPPMSEPRPTIVQEGSLGEAVRASGGAPFFGPYFHEDGRQLDGGLVAVVPPPALAEGFGADVVFAANAMALPAHRFPGEDIPVLGPLASLFYRYTLFGRIPDHYTAFATMVHSLGRAHADQSDHPVHTPPNDWTLFEPLEFFRAAHLAAWTWTPYQLAALRCRQLWDELP